MAVKGYVKAVDKALKKYTKKVTGELAYNNYKTETLTGFREGWALWYNNVLWHLMDKADEWIDKEGAAKVLAVKNIVKEASREYRKAKLGVVHDKYFNEVEGSHEIIVKALGAIGLR